jgi:hypothetical protein
MATLRTYASYGALALFLFDLLFTAFILITDTSGWGGIAVFAINLLVLPLIVLLLLLSQIHHYLYIRPVRYEGIAEPRGILNHLLPLRLVIIHTGLFIVYFIYYQTMPGVSTDAQDQLFFLLPLTLFLALILVMIYYLGLWISDSFRQRRRAELFPSAETG